MHYAFVLPVKNEENTIKEIIEKIILKLKSNNKLSFLVVSDSLITLMRLFLKLKT